MKHNKKRNTAFIYETLSRELTKAIVNKDAARRGKAVAILREFFMKGSPLAAELELYKILLDTQNVQDKVAERLLHETKLAHDRLHENTIFDAQSKIIAAINKGIGQDMWGNFVPNFKSLASVSAIFNPKTSVKKRVLFEQAIVDRMSARTDRAGAEELKSLDNLAYNSFIKKFNEKYTDLLQEQKELLNHYITSFGDDGFELRLYLNEELSRLKNTLTQKVNENTAPLIVTKVDGVLKYLESFRHREFTSTDLNKILKTQELVEELAAND